jgi:hypothetical protein
MGNKNKNAPKTDKKNPGRLWPESTGFVKSVNNPNTGNRKGDKKS